MVEMRFLNDTFTRFSASSILPQCFDITFTCPCDTILRIQIDTVVLGMTVTLVLFLNIKKEEFFKKNYNIEMICCVCMYVLHEMIFVSEDYIGCSNIDALLSIERVATYISLASTSINIYKLFKIDAMPRVK